MAGTGRGGRIRERDVRGAAATGTEKIVRLGPIRRATVAHLQKSQHATVPVTLTTTADVTDLMTRRREWGDPAPSVTDCFVQVVARALQRHPLLAARWVDDHLVLPDGIHIGIAVDTDAGLLVPVVRDAATLSLGDIATRSRDLFARARQGKLHAKEMEGGVFTITNLGMYGIDAFTPVLNWPECAVLGIGRIRRVPVFAGEQVIGRDQATLSMTFDHRIVDGAPAARFLQTLVQEVEKLGPPVPR